MTSASIRWAIVLLITLMSFAIAEEFLSPDQAFSPSITQSDDHPGRFEAQWDIADGYYLYQSRIALSVNGKALTPTYITLPELKQDPYFGEVDVFHEQAVMQANLPNNNAQPLELSVQYQGCAEEGLCYTPQTRTFTVIGGKAQPSQVNVMTEMPAVTVTGEQNSGALATWMASASTLWIIGTFFVLGLGLTFTPCVLPMIPILAGIIAGQGEQITTRKGLSLSLAYVLGMATTYTLAGVLVGFFGARLNLQSALQNPVALSIFAGVFVMLSLAMFGFYELQVPAFLRNRLSRVSQTDSAASGGAGRYASTALMGLVSALVVSPCVSAPLAGALIYISTTGNAWLGGGALFALSLGMGAPLLLVGAGGGRLLPKAGMWMVAVKNFFGVVLLAIAISLVARFVPGHLSLALWGLLALVYAAHVGLGGSVQTGWQKTRRGLAAALGIYSTSLLLGAMAGHTDPLQPLAGMNYTAGQTGDRVESETLFQRTASVDTLTAQLLTAQSRGQVAVLDLYADWCTSCQEMEDKVFSQTSAQRYAGDIRFLQLDITRNNAEQIEFLQQHGLFGPPALLFFDKAGNEQTQLRTLGEIDLEQWQVQLQTLQNAGTRPL
ncbi:protein-disulfide reductase DsbD [Saccharospirillum alexandrii]|uniref:protein-disulfide reductase DsbD n=1 Tax=Saccharospirillum alexandrii TaxID=2448477 RepID=UPI00373545C4